MPSNNWTAAATMESAGIGYRRDIPNTGEREPLLVQNTGRDIEKLSTRQVFVNHSWEVAQSNTGILLVVASEVFFAVMEATAKILQGLDPRVTAFQVRLNPNSSGYNIVICHSSS